MDMPFDEQRIGQHLYRVNMLTMDKWFELKERVTKLFLPVIAEAIAGGALNNIGALMNTDNLSEVEKLDPKMIAGVMYDYAQRVDAQQLFGIFQLLDGVTFCDNQMFRYQDMNVHFPKHMNELIPFFVFAMGVQFKDFFAGLGELGSLVSSMTGPSKSQNT